MHPDAFLSAFLVLLVLTSADSISLSMIEKGLSYYFSHPRYSEGIPFDTTNVKAEYDFVIVGGGTAGCVMANRLSEIPGWQVLLLEAGGDEVFLGEIPLFVHYLQLGRFNWGFRTEQQAGICGANNGRLCSWPRGKCLGGSSSINYMIYTRGHAQDYDDWEALGNPGWGYRNILKYFKKSENAYLKDVAGAEDGLQSPFHGTGGFLDVQDVPFRLPAASAFVDGAQEIGMAYNKDYNGARMKGVGYIQATMRNGTRVSSSKAFLRPVRGRSNLHVAKNSHVTKIIMDAENKRAVGVEFERGGKRFKVLAKKEVILSAGAINSPQILMLSGIGPKQHLLEKGIKTVVDLPGVGENLQDHVTFSGQIFLLNAPVTILEERISSLKYLEDYGERHTGPFTLAGGVEVIGYVDGAVNTSASDRAAIELLMVSGSLALDEGFALRKGVGVSDYFYNRYFRPIHGRDAVSIFPVVLKPGSRGSIKLRNADPKDWPIMTANYYSDPRDREEMAAALERSMKIVKTKAFQRYGATIYDTAIPGCERHTFASADYWKCAVGQLTFPLHHQCGTAKMGPSTDTMAVVDNALRVHGVKNLRVVDASIMPTIPSAHIYAPVIMIAEKASDMIKITWRSL
ncbi:hypothetical protein J437_LFUL002584 [Ladona fulva]|uniref:Glucose-methanol-choline oxidoreductase N-terminal domain-containing protein n=1 Tax=Ladona fulva TaxID=123851 RepID=A0A8K0NUX6_LADFU|nr:hypothetical protein J437_LFUL002584 [Ladona fulva]